jgi:hypothetical protein
MTRDRGRESLPNPKKWDEDGDADDGPDSMDLSDRKKARSAREVRKTHSTPEVETKDEPVDAGFEDDSGGLGNALRSVRYSLEAIWLRIQNAVSRVVQLAGLYLVVASMLDFFSAPLALGGIPVDSIPEAFWWPYQLLDVSVLFVWVFGLLIVWFSTSSWFLGGSRTL